MAEVSMDIQHALNQTRFSAFQGLVFGLCFLIVLLDGFDTSAIGYIAPSLMGEWGVAKPALAPVLSAALFGLAGGALTSGPLSDLFGRKKILILSVFLFALASCVSAFSSDLWALTIFRFVTGIGLGAAMPNAVTLMSEYCADRQRAMITNAMFCGFPLGAAMGGFLAAAIIPTFGWRAVLVLGGDAPALLAVILVFSLPESIRFIVTRAYSVARIKAIMVRISPLASEATAFTMTEPTPVKANKSAAALVLSPANIVGSLMLWLTYFMGLVIFYSMINWLPVLLKDVGLDPKTATLISAMFPLGGVGAVLSGYLMDRFNANWIIATCYALTAVLMYAIGQSTGTQGLLMFAVFVAGAMMNTAQASMPSLAAAFYPTQGRATGVAWMLGVGRFGGIAGSFLVAELTRQQLGFAAVFAVVAVPGVVAALALSVKALVYPEVRVVSSSV